MAIKLSDYDPAVAQGAKIDATNDASIGGDLVVTGAISGPTFFQTDATAATITVTAAQSGGTFLATKSSSTQTYTLPATALGLKYTFICGHASGEILINQAGSEVITITSFAAVGVDADTGIIAPAGGTGIKNTAATNAIGDCITLIASATAWYGVGISSGIWASQ